MSPSTTSEETAKHLSAAVAIATENVHNHGGPFGAVIVAADGRTFSGVNRVTADNDPTAHAEVVAIRRACAEMGTFDLAGCALYTSCEPCPMCLASSLWARLESVYFAADRHDAAKGGFDDAEFYEFFAQKPEDRSLQVEQVELNDHTAPFDAWRALADRTDY